MWGFGRFIAGLILFVAILAGLGYLLRAPLAGAALRWQLASAGFDNPSLAVSDFTVNHLALTNVQAGGDRNNPSLAVEKVEVRFDWRTLLFERKATSLAVGPGRLTVRIADDGALSLAGYRFEQSSAGGVGKGAPFKALTVDDLEYLIRAPEGAATGSVSGRFTEKDGGSLSVIAQTTAIEANGLRAENARFDGSVDLKPDGAATLTGDLSGDFAAAGATVRRVKLSVNGEGGSWRDALSGKGVEQGDARIALSSAEISVRESPSLGWLKLWRAPNEAAIETLSLSGELSAVLADGRLTVAVAEGKSLRAASDRGDILTISPREAAPIYQATSEGKRLAADVSLSDEAAAADFAFSAERGRPDLDAGDAGWRFDVSAAFDKETFPAVSFGATKLAATGTLANDVIDADVVISTNIDSARIGRLKISQTALGSTFRVRTDLATKELEASNYDAACVNVKRTRLTFEGQDTEIRLADAEYCRPDGALITARWGDGAGAEIGGVLKARDSRLQLARTRFEGAPPSVKFDASYSAQRQVTQVAGTFSGGRVKLNNALIASDAAGRFTFTLDHDEMSADSALDRVRIVQNRKLLFVAPVVAAGTAKLAEDRISFDYTASTLDGRPLGAGEGVHDIRSGRGETTFHSGDIKFAPDGLQPASLVLSLTGIIGDAEGAASGDVHAEWGPRAEDFKTSGRFALDNLSFIGPGRAITRTGGVTGELTLANLIPLESNGAQSLEVKLIDLDSLKLENGSAQFELPGDETIHIIKAEFPWYGGTIGAYDTVAALTGDKAKTALKVDNVDLGALLDLANVEGLSGEGKLSGTLPIVFENGRARIVNGKFESVGPGAIHYVGKASQSAVAAGSGAKIAFSILRDLRFTSLTVTINGYLDGRINFVSQFRGTGEVAYEKASGRLPVRYTITLDAALLELLKQAQMSRDIRLQIEEGRVKPQPNAPEPSTRPQ